MAEEYFAASGVPTKEQQDATNAQLDVLIRKLFGSSHADVVAQKLQLLRDSRAEELQHMDNEGVMIQLWRDLIAQGISIELFEMEGLWQSFTTSGRIAAKDAILQGGDPAATRREGTPSAAAAPLSAPGVYPIESSWAPEAPAAPLITRTQRRRQEEREARERQQAYEDARVAIPRVNQGDITPADVVATFMAMPTKRDHFLTSLRHRIESQGDAEYGSMGIPIVRAAAAPVGRPFRVPDSYRRKLAEFIDRTPVEQLIVQKGFSEEAPEVKASAWRRENPKAQVHPPRPLAASLPQSASASAPQSSRRRKASRPPAGGQEREGIPPGQSPRGSQTAPSSAGPAAVAVGHSASSSSGGAAIQHASQPICTPPASPATSPRVSGGVARPQPPPPRQQHPLSISTPPASPTPSPRGAGGVAKAKAPPPQRQPTQSPRGGRSRPKPPPPAPPVQQEAPQPGGGTAPGVAT